MRAWLAALLLILAPAMAEAANCTDGTNCFCDTAAVTGDARRLFCEDWEILTLWDARGVAGAPSTGPSGCSVGANPATANCANATSPTWGPWYDKGAETVRGKNSYWRQTYGSTSGFCAWTNGAPSSPTYGVSCPGSSTCYQGEYRDDDSWQANSFACIDIIKDSANEWDDEVGTDLAPLRPDGSRGGYGSQTFAHRIKTASGALTDTTGRKDWGAVQEVGVTMLVAYSTDVESSPIWGDAWKHDGFGDPVENFMMMMDNNSGTGISCSETGPSPFCLSVWTSGGTAACNAALANPAWTPRKGQFDCSNPATFRFYADQTAYTRATRWPNLNKWACVRMHVRGIAASGHTLGMTETVDFGDGVDRTIVDFDGFDNAITASGENLVRSIAFNGYSNYKETHSIPASVRRYEENVYVRGGTTAQCAGNACVPISCTDAGFYEGGSAPSTPTISLSTSTLSTNTTVNSNPASQTFTIQNGGGGTLQYTVSDNAAWMTASLTGSVTSEADIVTVSFQTAALSAGTYTGTITVADNGSSPAATNSPQTIAVTAVVAAVPTLTITSVTESPSSGTVPLNNVSTTITVGGTATGNVTLEVDCTNDGSYDISFVDTASPWTISNACSYAAPATYTVGVRATRQGIVATSSTTLAVTAAATLGISSVTPSPTSGTVPFTGISLAVTVTGTATGTAVISADCDNNGSYEAVSGALTISGSTFTYANACGPYTTTGTKTIPVKIVRQTVMATSSTSVIATGVVTAPSSPNKVIFNRPAFRQGAP